MKKTILFSLILVCFVGFSQVPNKSDLEDGEIVIEKTHINESKEDENNPNQIYNTVETKPEYPGGIGKFYQYVGQNYRIPNELQKTGVNGTVIVSFVVEKDGSLTDIKVIRDLGYGTGEEAIRVLKKSKKWRPGIQKGKAVRVSYTLPIRLVVETEQEIDTQE